MAYTLVKTLQASMKMVSIKIYILDSLYLALLNTRHRALDIELLRTFHAASALGTLHAVAIRRHLTLGAVSQQIKRLETQLNQTLLIRSKSGVRLTLDGAQLLADSSRLLEEHDALLDRLSNHSASGMVRLGCPEEYAPYLLDSLLPRLRTTHPAIRLHLFTATSGELSAALARGELELAIVVAFDGAAERSGLPLWRTRPIWAGSTQNLIPFSTTVPLALHPESCPYRQLGLNALHKAGRDWEIVFSSASVAAIELAVASGISISVIDRDRLTPRMRELGPSDGFPTLPECLAKLIEAPGISKADIDAVGIVRDNLQHVPFMMPSHDQASLKPANAKQTQP